MDKRINFTKKKIEELPIPASGERAVYHDEHQPNLIVRVSPSGRKVFYVRRKMHAISERISIGRFPEVSVEQARKKAASILAEIAAGSNPKDATRKLKAEPTIGELFDLYMVGHAQQRCVRVADMRKDFERYINDWKNRKFSQLKRADVQARINALFEKHGPGPANHILILLRALINWNLRNETITGDNPCASIRQYKIQARERFLTPDELVKFFAALRKVSDQTIHDYVLISLYTGARRSNVLAMRWDQIDFNLAIWRIPLTKNKDSHVVPLTVAALEILAARSEVKESPWVFPGKDPASHLVEPKRPWYKLLEMAEIQDLRIHDLRRTLASYMAMGNQSLPIIAKALGHKSIAATQIYSRLMADPVRRAMETAQADMTAAMKALEDASSSPA
jgi:integrase